MRTKALILFFPFAVFLAETASFIPAMKDACAIIAAKRSSCKMEKKQDACSRKKENSCCAKNKQPVNTDTKAPADNKCNDNPGCSTCPVCYTFIVQQQYEWQARQFIAEKNYSLVNTGCISSYIPDVWKPPNDILYAS